MTKLHEAHIVIVGAGTAGLFCSWLLAQNNIPHLLMEAGHVCGRKLAVSGGGHANFSNKHISADNYLIPGNPSFCNVALKKFGTEKIIALMESWGLSHREKEHGRLFLKHSASKLRDCLLKDSHPWQQLLLHTRINAIVSHKPGGYHIFAQNSGWRCRILVLALGSPAHPRQAGCDNCWQPLKQLELPIQPASPVLAPLLYADNQYDQLKHLTGISVPVKVTIGSNSMTDGKEWQDDLLFTHKGLSGPVIFNASLYWRDDSILNVDMLPGKNFEKLLDANENKTPFQLLRRFMPDRLAASLLHAETANRKIAEISRKTREQIGALINRRQFKNLVCGSVCMAEACSGGVDSSVLSPKSMECVHWPNLYILGEMQNVTGELGGYNLHWAFASAWSAALDIINKQR